VIERFGDGLLDEVPVLIEFIRNDFLFGWFAYYFTSFILVLLAEHLQLISVADNDVVAHEDTVRADVGLEYDELVLLELALLELL